MEETQINECVHQRQDSRNHLSLLIATTQLISVQAMLSTYNYHLLLAARKKRRTQGKRMGKRVRLLCVEWSRGLSACQGKEKMVIPKKPNRMCPPNHRISAVLLMPQRVQELRQVPDASGRSSLFNDLFPPPVQVALHSQLEQSYSEIQPSTPQKALLALQLHRAGINCFETSVWSNGDGKEWIT